MVYLIVSNKLTTIVSGLTYSLAVLRSSMCCVAVSTVSNFVEFQRESQITRNVYLCEGGGGTVCCIVRKYKT